MEGYLDPVISVSVKSRAGNIIQFGNVPILSVHKRQTQMDLSTIEAESTSLSQSMQDLIQT